jgi:hypothetical protein
MDEKQESQSGCSTCKKVEFKPPTNFKTPEGTEEGKEWDMVCSFETKPDGTVCMTKLGDTPMPGYDGKEDSDDHKPSYQKYSSSLMQGMQGGMSAGDGSTGGY